MGQALQATLSEPLLEEYLMKAMASPELFLVPSAALLQYSECAKHPTHTLFGLPDVRFAWLSLLPVLVLPT